MTDELTTTLDYIDNITVKGNPFAEPANEYYALLYLKTGLDFLYRQAEKCDQIALKQLDPKKQYFSFGNSPLLTGIPYKLLTCAFHWYSISACQYVRTVGAISYLQDNSRPRPPGYTKSVIPEVLAFRDKVSAHFAWSSQHEQDNEAERLASIIPQVVWCKDTFQVQVFIISKTSSGKSSNSKIMQPWSITKIHQRLRERYWPDEIETK
jgi:hypothetical protein